MKSASATILTQIQTEARVWGAKNFGSKFTRETQLLGVVEEHGEAMAAIGDPDPEDFVDSVGDSAIYLIQFASLMHWDIGDLWEGRHAFEDAMPPRPWPILIGRIAHHYVKGHVQLYRGTQAEHDEKCMAAIATLLLHWEQRLALQNADFVAIVEKTWAEVSKRDWAKARPPPGVDDDNEFEYQAMTLPDHQQMSEETAREWAAGAGAAVGGREMIAQAIRRAYAHGVLVGRGADG